MEFQLRAWQPEDAAGLAQFANNASIAQNLRDVFPHPYTLADAQSYVQSCISGDPAAQLTQAICIHGRAVGSIGLFRGSDVYRKSAELGYWLAENFWGQGIMTSAVRQLCQAGFAQWDIVRIYAEPFAHNLGSRRVLEKAGFRLEGILRQSVCKQDAISDSCLYALLREDTSV